MHLHLLVASFFALLMNACSSLLQTLGSLQLSCDQSKYTQVLAINKRVQTQNKAPLGFPNFVREGYEIIILADGYEENQDGLIWKVSVPLDLSRLPPAEHAAWLLLLLALPVRNIWH